MITRRMLQLLALLLAFCPARAGQASPAPDFTDDLMNDVKEYVKESPEARARLLIHGLAQRCLDYSYRKTLDPEARSRCARSAIVTIRELDQDRYTTIENGKPFTTFLAFRNDLRRVLEDKNVTPFLRQYLLEDGTFFLHANLWETALKYAGDRSRALQWVAVLFQDTSPRRTHLRFAEQVWGQSASPTMKVNLDLVSQILERYESWDLADPLGKSKPIHWPYPPEFQDEIGSLPRPYHFYVMAYLSQLLRKNGETPAADTAYMPLTLNTYYEVTTLPGAGVASLIHDPGKITDEESLNDIYLGYLGSHFGSRLPGRPISRSYFSQRLTQDVPRMMRDLYFYIFQQFEKIQDGI
jgi:hypothetical protein